MQVRWRVCAMVGIVLPGLFAVSGCCVSEEAMARRTGTTFLRSARQGDTAALRGILTQEAQANMGQDPESIRRLARRFRGKYTIDRTEVSGDTARMYFTRTEGAGRDVTGYLQLRRQGAEWRVSGVTLRHLPDGREFTLDLESPAYLLVDALQQLPDLMAEGLRALGDSFVAAGEALRVTGEEIQKQARPAENYTAPNSPPLRATGKELQKQGKKPCHP
ncbi:MAG: hypothetical protein RMJ43_00655 [Chloroherpetonaceae bacterium]|nr:hypothetical protein [Chthonomonadaceae bacterium]MDW8206319.1 hypothetical protein [Chloroherpetonaceae bacterium]